MTCYIPDMLQLDWSENPSMVSNVCDVVCMVIESVRLFVGLFVVNAKITARIDAKRSRITTNDPESVLYVLKSPV